MLGAVTNVPQTDRRMCLQNVEGIAPHRPLSPSSYQGMKSIVHRLILGVNYKKRERSSSILTKISHCIAHLSALRSWNCAPIQKSIFLDIYGSGQALRGKRYRSHRNVMYSWLNMDVFCLHTTRVSSMIHPSSLWYQPAIIQHHAHHLVCPTMATEVLKKPCSTCIYWWFPGITGWQKCIFCDVFTSYGQESPPILFHNGMRTEA